MATIETGWTGACSPVTLGSGNGWDTNFDDLVFDGGPGAGELGAATVDGAELAPDASVVRVYLPSVRRADPGGW